MGALSRRLTVSGVKVNFLIFYEIEVIDQQTVKTVLRLDDYDSEWVLLASLDAAVPTEPGPRADADPGPADVDADM
jgi:hypothetical protein